MNEQTIKSITDTIATIKTPISPTGFGMKIDIPMIQIFEPKQKELSLSSYELEEKIKWRDYLIWRGNK